MPHTGTSITHSLHGFREGMILENQGFISSGDLYKDYYKFILTSTHKQTLLFTSLASIQKTTCNRKICLLNITIIFLYTYMLLANGHGELLQPSWYQSDVKRLCRQISRISKSLFSLKNHQNWINFTGQTDGIFNPTCMRFQHIHVYFCGTWNSNTSLFEFYIMIEFKFGRKKLYKQLMWSANYRSKTKMTLYVNKILFNN